MTEKEKIVFIRSTFKKLKKICPGGIMLMVHGFDERNFPKDMKIEEQGAIGHKYKVASEGEIRYELVIFGEHHE